MTTAPSNLLAVRKLLLAELGPHGLASAEVGIVGNTAHVAEGDSYHLGRPEQRSTGYSVSESSRDAAGLSEFASGLDVGTFSVRSGGATHNLISFSNWCVAECRAGAADTRDIREIIYSPDGRTVRRWDRMGRRSSGDDSHLFHTHFSYFRDSTKAGRDQTPLLRRYLTTIGLLEDDDMLPEDRTKLNEIHTALMRPDGRETIGALYLRLAVGKDDRPDAKPVTHPTLASLGGQLTGVQANLTKLAGKDFVDEPAIVEGVLAGLGGRPVADVVRALVAAGIDPADLRDEAAKQAASSPQS